MGGIQTNGKIIQFWVHLKLKTKIKLHVPLWANIYIILDFFRLKSCFFWKPQLVMGNTALRLVFSAFFVSNLFWYNAMNVYLKHRAFLSVYFTQLLLLHFWGVTCHSQPVYIYGDKATVDTESGMYFLGFSSRSNHLADYIHLQNKM